MSIGRGLPAKAAADRVAIVGAGIAGLAAAVRLAAWGADVTVFDSAERVGGKIAEIEIGGHEIDCGPTVVTMRWVFDELFAAAGTDIDWHLSLTPAEVLARHAWRGSERLDLFADVERTAQAIDGFAGSDKADRYRGFCERSARVYRTLEQPFIRSARPSPLGLATSGGFAGLRDLTAIEPFSTLWQSLSAQFRDPRLRQLFARYATYCGSSPFQSPATLMLVAHVEQRGVWTIEGGMHSLPKALAAVARSCGATLRLSTPVESVIVQAGTARGVRLAGGEIVTADAVVYTGEVSALATGPLGPAVRRAAPPLPVGADAVDGGVVRRLPAGPAQRVLRRRLRQRVRRHFPLRPSAAIADRLRLRPGPRHRDGGVAGGRRGAAVRDRQRPGDRGSARI